jgi:chitinase
MLLDFSLFNPLGEKKTHVGIAACAADLSTTVSAAGNGSTTSGLCLPDTNSNTTEKVTAQLQLMSSSGTQSGSTDSVVEALNEIQALSGLRSSGCNETIQFALSGEVAVGIYAGSGLSAQGILPSVLEQLVDHVQNNGFSDGLLVQLCDASGRSARYSLGVIVVAGSDLASAQAAVQTWKNSSCVSTTSNQTAQTWQNITFSVPSSTPPSSSNSSNSTSAAAGSLKLRRGDDECTTVQIVSGDSCTTLAEECGITLTEFEGYNDDLCDSPLQPGQYVCCSEGTLPDYSPQPDDDDNCYVYLVETGDDCSTIAAAYALTVDEIESYNNDTWGWMGCDDLLANMNICLSSGWPPMPTEIENAVCGPQVPDTPVASHGTNLSTLNECPLNACCDIWGQCGTTAEFCTISKSPTGAPGTAAVGENGCISNCGTDIVIDGSPSQIYSIAYFEGFDWSRPCLTMSISEVDTTSYTHIHFAFATINMDYTLNITAIEGQLPFFSALTGVKRILSIGGWDFSTSPSTYNIFREAVTSANRGTLIQSVADVLETYDLDGVDWDWEYPDEPDIPGIPAGTEADSTNYYVTLVQLKALLDGTGRTISLTAPASFWYLQAFPIKAMGAVVNYIVYMTYDLHGQWDYGNAYADPGCEEGNCLRSHVNLTETINSLSMITKAGVSNTQLVVGVASYGRAFKMTTAGCWTEMCTYTGPDAGALAGECTETAGYLANAEIESIIADNPSAQVYWDSDAFSNVLVYNDTEWVSYMNGTNKAVRILLYEVYGFLGYADWAVDLEEEGGSGSDSSSSSGGSLSTGYIAPSIWSEATPVVTGLPGQTLVWPPLQLSSTTTISFDPWTTLLSYSTLSTTTYVGVNSETTTQHVYDVLTIATVLTIEPGPYSPLELFILRISSGFLTWVSS